MLKKLRVFLCTKGLEPIEFFGFKGVRAISLKGGPKNPQKPPSYPWGQRPHRLFGNPEKSGSTPEGIRGPRVDPLWGSRRPILWENVGENFSAWGFVLAPSPGMRTGGGDPEGKMNPKSCSQKSKPIF